MDQDDLESNPKSLFCLFCKAAILFPGLPAKRYKSHLLNDHNVMFEVDLVIQWTLRIQIPEMADPLDCNTCKKDNSNQKTADLPNSTLKSIPSENHIIAAQIPAINNSTSKKAVTKQIVPKQELHQPTNENVEVNEFFHENENFFTWSRGKCTFSCALCQTVVMDLVDLTSHVISVHKMKINEYLKCFGDPCTQETSLSCNLCGEKIRHDFSTLKSHIEDGHNLSLVLFFEKFVDRQRQKSEIDNGKLQAEKETAAVQQPTTTPQLEDDDDEIECLGMFTGSNLPPIKKEIKIEQGCTNSSVSSSTKETEENIYNISETQSFSEFEESQPSQVEQNPSVFKAPWYCGTLYECKICKNQFYEIPDLKRHVSNAHETDLDDISNSHGDPAVATNIHECVVCGKGMMHNYSSIRSHIKMHGLNIAAYYEQYKKDLDLEEVLLPITDPALIMKMIGRKATSKMPNDSSNLEEYQLQQQNYDWFNRCTFACKLCPYYKVKSYGTFVSHLKTTHKLTTKAYVEEHGSFCIDDVQHTCQICGTLQRWDRGTIQLHLSRYHGSVSADDYVAAYRDSYNDNPNFQDNESDKWMNRCIFECLECNPNKQFNTKRKLILHLKLDHQMTKKEYYKKHRNFSTTSAQHECKICSKVIMWESDSIKSHLEKTHSITAEDYLKKYLNENDLKQTSDQPKSDLNGRNITKNWDDKCVFSCSVCFIPQKNKSSLRSHLIASHNMKEAYYQEHFGSKILHKTTHSCLLCNTEILFDSLTIRSHLHRNHDKMTIEMYRQEHFDKFALTETPEQSVVSDWINRCMYCCKICFLAFKGKYVFKNHVISDHSMTFADYTKQHGSCVMEETYHTCQVKSLEGKLCCKETLWDERSMTNHFAKHNLSPEDYYKRFMKDYEASRLNNLKSDQQDWMNRCSFLCKICTKVFNIKKNLLAHITEAHNVTCPEDGSVVSCLLHSCQICNENVLWEEEKLINHLQTQHSLHPQDYASKYLQNYRENEECAIEIYKLDSWMNCCIFKCVLCVSSVTFDKKSKLANHLAQHHKENRAGYFKQFEEDTIVQSTDHVCQICSKKMIWDESAIQRHIERAHKLKVEIYRAKYMQTYTEDADLIGQMRKEENKLARFPKKIKAQTSTPQESDTFISLPDDGDEDWGTTEKVRTWARGCLYNCQICESDFVGARAFTVHLVSSHQTSLQSYKKKYRSCNTNVIVGYHFCKLCCNNVRHDETDLYNHFQKEHKSNIVDYFNQFRNKLRMPRLERPMTEVIKNTETNPTQDSSAKKRKRPTESVGGNGNSTKKKFSLANEESLTSDGFGQIETQKTKTEIIPFAPSTMSENSFNNINLSSELDSKLDFYHEPIVEFD